MRFRKILLGITLVLSCAVVIAAQQPTEQRAALNEAATASDGKAAAAIEARLLTTVLNGSEDSPVTNVRIVVKNVSANFYTYVSGWATFYDSSAVRCGEGRVLGGQPVRAALVDREVLVGADRSRGAFDEVPHRADGIGPEDAHAPGAIRARRDD